MLGQSRLSGTIVAKDSNKITCRYIQIHIINGPAGRLYASLVISCNIIIDQMGRFNYSP